MYNMRVLMFPWLSHGHTVPFIELAKKLIQRHFYIYVYSTHANLSSIKPYLTEEHIKSIEFVEFQLPSIPELPPHYQSTKNLPHTLKLALQKALDMTQSDFSNILEKLRPDLVIYDVVPSWPSAEALKQNIPAVGFIIIGTAAHSYASHEFKRHGEPFPFKDMYIPSYLVKRCVPSHVGIKNWLTELIDNSCEIAIANTSTDLEGKYIDYMFELMDKKVMPVGPLVRDLHFQDDNKEIMEWLDNKENNSVVYVSFGSEASLTRDEFRSVALGLELSKLNFIWAVRFLDGENVTLEEALPEGYPERIGQRGLLLQNWVPQGRILAHPNTGVFLSHCGWNASLESVTFGVPIIAMPLIYEQPMNARLLAEIGVAKELVRDDDGNFEAEQLAKLIREVVMEESGDPIRRRVKELSDITKNKNKGEEHIDALVDEFKELAESYKANK